MSKYSTSVNRVSSKPSGHIWPALRLYLGLYLGLALAIVATSFVESAYAANRCEVSIEKPPLRAMLSRGLTEANFYDYETEILKMAKVLLRENKEALVWGHENSTMEEDLNPKIGDIENFEIQSIHLLQPTKGPYFLVGARTTDPWSQNTYAFSIRTNGRVAFLAETYRLRRPKKAQRYSAVASGRSGVTSFDQGLSLLATLPENATIYRQMSEAERAKWSSGEMKKSRGFGTKIHFSPTRFEFDGNPSYPISIQRSMLEEMYSSGELELNSYDEVGGDQMDMPELGMEFELVFVGSNAIQKIAPLMQKALKGASQK